MCTPSSLGNELPSELESMFHKRMSICTMSHTTTTQNPNPRPYQNARRIASTVANAATF